MTKYTQKFYENLSAASKQSARIILDRLNSAYQFTTVVDFGCGQGAWLSAAEDLGCKKLRGYDGAWVDDSKMLPKNVEFIPVSEENFFPSEEKYDLCVSVEVAEHLSEKSSVSFINSLCASSDVVIFSAAIKGQGGTGHINEQWQSYWVDKFNKNNFQCFDIFRGAVWNDDRIEWWYRQNIFLFVNRDLDSSIISRKKLLELSEPIFDIAHPEMINKFISNPLFSIKRYFQNFR